MDGAMPADVLKKDKVKLGFIGLGIMGSRLTRRLHAAGWNIRAWNRNPETAREFSESGIPVAGSIVELVAGSDVILSSLANDAAVDSVYRDDAGVFASAMPGTIILEMSTISPDLSQLLHSEASVRGLRLLDLPVSGSAPAVEAGTVTLLAGGDQSTFELCTPIYESIAKQWFRMGDGAAGVQMKLVVNLLLGVGMQAVAEAVSLGEHLELDRAVLLDALSKTAVIPPALVGKFKKIESGDYSPQFPLRLMSKDMDLILETAKAAGADLPAACATKSVLDANVEEKGDLDLSAITPFMIHHASEQSNLRDIPETNGVCS
jgi:3-hydroxyisobutyrate dehydrogenase-like beta-hydroxyacid dehydrogenase